MTAGMPHQEIVKLITAFFNETPSASAREISGKLNLDKSTINSLLYANKAIFQSIGERPPIWSLIETENEKGVRTSAPNSSSPDKLEDIEAGGEATPETLLIRHDAMHDDISNDWYDSQSELIAEVEAMVKKFPGITFDELLGFFDVTKEQMQFLIRDVAWLVMVDDFGAGNYSEDELKHLDAIRKAGTYSFPLSTNTFDDLIARGFINSVSSMRIMQIFGSWRAACELAGVEAPKPIRPNYERRWTERELAEVVARYLMEPQFRGAIQHYDSWRQQVQNADEIPSSGTLKNYLGRSWITVRNRGLAVLRERWLSSNEGIDDE